MNIKHLGMVLQRAAEHRGTAFVEVYQNCVVFNDGAFDYATDRDLKADTILELEHGKPLVFGKNRDKGIRLNGLEPEVVELGNGITEDDLLFHDEKAPEPSLAYLLSRMRHDDGFPEPIGVFRAVERRMYDDELNRQIARGPREAGARRSEHAVPFRRNLDGLMIICPYCEHGEHARRGCLRAVREFAERPEPARAGERGGTQPAGDRVSAGLAAARDRRPGDAHAGSPADCWTSVQVGCVMVVEQGKLVGIFTERDVLLKIGADAATSGPPAGVAKFMTPNPQTLRLDAKIAFAVQRMDLGGFRHIPIVSAEQRTGRRHFGPRHPAVPDRDDGQQ